MSEFKNHTPFLPLKVFTWEYLLVSTWNFSLRLPFWRCYYNLDAGAVLSCNGKVYQPDQHQILLIPPEVQTETNCLNPFHQFYVHFSLEWNIRNPDKHVFEIPSSIFTPELLARLCRDDGSRDRHRLLAVYSFVTGVMANLPPSILEPWTRDDMRIKNLLDTLEANDDLCRNNAVLAARLNLSENGFVRLFTETIGISPQKYLRGKRIEKACWLLHFTEDSIDDIAANTGFIDRYHFSKVFHSVTGSWPAAFRKDKKLWQTNRTHPNKV